MFPKKLICEHTFFLQKGSLLTFNALTPEGALKTLIDFTLSNARRFYSSMGNPFAVKLLTTSKTVPITALTAEGAHDTYRFYSV